MTALAGLSDDRRRDVVSVALDHVLREAQAPLSTSDVVEAVLKVLGSDERKLVARLVLKLAETRVEAQRSSLTVRRYGKTMQPWVWTPTAHAPGNVSGPLAASEYRPQSFTAIGSNWRGTAVRAVADGAAAGELSAADHAAITKLLLEEPDETGDMWTVNPGE